MHFKSIWKIWAIYLSQVGSSRIKKIVLFLSKEKSHVKFFWRQWRLWEMMGCLFFFFLEYSAFKFVLSLRKLTNGRTKQIHFTYRTLIKQELHELNKFELWQTFHSPKNTHSWWLKYQNCLIFPLKNAWNQMGFPKDIWSELLLILKQNSDLIILIHHS